MEKIAKSNAEWQRELDPEIFHITREKGTELPFTGEYDNFYLDGMYHCSNCGQPLFSSETKYDAGCGWPSFTAPINNEFVETKTDHSQGMVRQEIVCRRCGAHLGHVFDDGPGPDGHRYCVNSASLRFTVK